MKLTTSTVLYSYIKGSSSIESMKHYMNSERKKLQYVHVPTWLAGRNWYGSNFMYSETKETESN